MLKAPKFWYQNKISILAILLLPISLLWIIGTFFKKKFGEKVKIKKIQQPKSLKQKLGLGISS